MASPSKQYFLKSQVNRADSKRPDYALVTLLLVDKEHQPLDTLNTHAADIMSWAVGWAGADTLVVYSGDIGSQSWLVSQGRFRQVPLTPWLHRQAEAARRRKYAD